MSDRENQRLLKLRSYAILDTDAEPSFDKIAKLASAICETPIALVSLVDESRQWFKACVGLKDVHETHRNISFCTYAIREDSVFVVEDALLDERFMTNPLVLGEPNIRFYAGAPLRTNDGYNLGTLCVIDSKPHQLTPLQREALVTLSDQVVELIELRKTNDELRKTEKLLEEQKNLLINKARLQTIGELAGGICHQINNPLAIIVGRSMILRSSLKDIVPQHTELLKELDVIDQTSQRISDILKALRFYSKDLGTNVSETSVHQLIEDVLTLIRGKITKENIDFSVEMGEDLKMSLNKNQISQVILDLLNNSIEAMEESEKRTLAVRIEENSDHILLKIIDSGKGIKNEDSEKIFEPFFTTKGRHFGVGLYNAVNFIRQHNGQIRLLSQSNPTVFEVKLPKSA